MINSPYAGPLWMRPSLLGASSPLTVWCEREDEDGAVCSPQSLHLSRLPSSAADICQKLDPVSAAHGPGGELGDPGLFGLCLWPSDHGCVAKPPGPRFPPFLAKGRGYFPCLSLHPGFLRPAVTCTSCRMLKALGGLPLLQSVSLLAALPGPSRSVPSPQFSVGYLEAGAAKD